MHTITLAYGQSVKIGNTTYFNFDFPCQARPPKPAPLSKGNVQLPYGSTVISPSVTINCLRK
jgi:hypothetical protein